MTPMPEDEIAALFRSAYGGDANVELRENGLNVWVQPANGGSIYARLEDADSLVLAALLGVYRMPDYADPGDSRTDLLSTRVADRDGGRRATERRLRPG
jgi:hypothetical protein